MLTYRKIRKYFRDKEKYYRDAEINQLKKQYSRQKFYQDLLLFKENYPVNDIKIDKEQVWPLLRSEITIHLYLLALEKKAWGEPFNPYLSQMCHPSQITYEHIAKARQVFPVLDIDDLPDNQIDFLFFTQINSTEQVELAYKEIWHRLTDPILMAALEIGSVDKVEILKAMNLGNIRKIGFYHYPAKLLSPPNRQIEIENCITYPADLIKKLNQFFPYISFDEQIIKNFFMWQVHMKKYYIKILSRKKPKFVFFFPYFYHMPLIKAAKELGIKTVEIQHGIMSGENPIGYDNWQEINKEGINYLPDYFWVWGEYEKKRITKAFSHITHNAPKAIIGGNAWLDMHYENISDSHKELLKKVINNKKSKHALITLQVDGKIPRPIKILIKASNSITYYIRHHPKGQKTSLRGRNIVSNRALDTIPLKCLLPLMDAHLTESSSSVLEANYYGVRNFVCGEAGRRNYGSFIDSGLVHYFSEDNTRDVIHLISEKKTLDNAEKVNYIDKVNAKETLLEIMKNESKNSQY